MGLGGLDEFGFARLAVAQDGALNVPDAAVLEVLQALGQGIAAIVIGGLDAGVAGVQGGLGAVQRNAVGGGQLGELDGGGGGFGFLALGIAAPDNHHAGGARLSQFVLVG